MSVRAGEILHVAGNNVIDRIQSAGLGNVQVPIERILEVGNRETVDKVPGEPDFTFSLESLDVSVELLAFLSGRVSAAASGSASVAETVADGTEFDWLDVAGRAINIASPWKDPSTGSAGVVEAGHLIPGYYVTRMAYRYGVTDNATQSVDLSGGAFFYGEFAPTEAFFTGDGATDDFVTPNNAVGYRKGGADGTTFKSVFGVIVDGTLQTEDVDYTVTPTTVGAGARTVTFTNPPANGADVRLCYFTNAAKAFPQTVHASTLVKPGAVRGRNIKILVNGDRIGGVQSFELDATCTGTLEREMGTEDVVGYTLTETNANGTITIRAKDKDAFFTFLSEVTGVSRAEVFGWFNQNSVELEVLVENPKNPGQILKTLYVNDAQFQPPGTPARVNQATDFAITWESKRGSFKEYKGERP
ncbi:MAG: hypothetical protein QOF36_2537 [Microbacteriaceae bacterium]|jgi:hypothetical protein|nr:hypothetical protein [Microbacteriaceae bacterium]